MSYSVDVFEVGFHQLFSLPNLRIYSKIPRDKILDSYLVVSWDVEFGLTWYENMPFVGDLRPTLDSAQDLACMLETHWTSRGRATGCEVWHVVCDFEPLTSKYRVIDYAAPWDGRTHLSGCVALELDYVPELIFEITYFDVDGVSRVCGKEYYVDVVEAANAWAVAEYNGYKLADICKTDWSCCYVIDSDYNEVADRLVVVEVDMRLSAQGC